MNKLHFKVGLFAVASLLLAGAFLVYLLHARGFFEDTFHLQLAAASADGVAPGVPIVFSGIEIGRVTTLGLNEEGGIVIHAEFMERNAKWLKETSTFTLDKPIVGGARIHVDSPDLDAPALPDDATVLLLTSDISKELPALVERVKAVLDNVEYLTRKDGEINATLANVKTVTGRMTGEYGMLESILGSPEKARAVTDSLDKTRALIGKLDGLVVKVDGMARKTDQWLFAPDGMAAIEIGYDQKDAVSMLLDDAGLTVLALQDLAGHDRCLVATMSKGTGAMQLTP